MTYASGIAIVQKRGHFICSMFAYKYTVFVLLNSGLLGLKKTFCKSEYLGSTKYVVILGELLEKEKKTHDTNTTLEKKTQRAEGERSYTLNKKIVRRKMFAFSQLRASRAYFRLWSISFPNGTCDEICYKLWNLWLTRMRSEAGLKSYLWVAERQKNGTLHFHVAINSYIDVRLANNLMSKSINNYIKKGLIPYTGVGYLNYNGVDVSKKAGSPRALAKYITKYITKNSTECNRLPYYCSQDISCLFVARVFSEAQLDAFLQECPTTINKEVLFSSDYCDFYAINKLNIRVAFADMFRLNDFIYSLFP